MYLPPFSIKLGQGLYALIGQAGISTPIPPRILRNVRQWLSGSEQLVIRDLLISTHRPLPSHLSQFGHFTGGGVGVDPSKGSSESLQYVVGLAILGVVNEETPTNRSRSKKRMFMVIMYYVLC